MKLIILSIDHNLLNRESATSLRMSHYGTYVGEIDVILVGASGESLNLSQNVRVYPVAGTNKASSSFKALSLARQLVKSDTVIVVQDPFEMGLWGLVVSWITKCPLNVQIHIDFFSPYFRRQSVRQYLQSMIAPFVLRRADSVRAVSGKIAEYLKDELGVDAKKITIAPVFVDLNIIKNKSVTIDLHSKFPQFDWIILVACRYVKQKNIPLAIEAFEIFKKTHPKAGLVIAGSGPEESTIKEIVVEKDLEESVKIGSWADEFASCMKTCDTFLLSSDYEGWGMTVIEAASLGKPVIMTDVGCANEFLIHEKDGLIVPTRDPEALAVAMSKYYDNRAFAKNMGLAAERSASTYMTMEENDMLMKKSWESAVRI